MKSAEETIKSIEEVQREIVKQAYISGWNDRDDSGEQEGSWSIATAESDWERSAAKEIFG